MMDASYCPKTIPSYALLRPVQKMASQGCGQGGIEKRDEPAQAEEPLDERTFLPWATRLGRFASRHQDQPQSDVGVLSRYGLIPSPGDHNL